MGLGVGLRERCFERGESGAGSGAMIRMEFGGKHERET